ncbi:MAG TPA: ABC transporter permease [Vicinamibacteria bacterium]|nr:ABC transporter permease [Vicinamibacteria bacterium]
MDGLIQDLRYGVRGLVRRPGFALVALLTLAIGIGANAAIFTMVDALLLKPLPFGDRSARVVSLHSTHRTQAEDWDDSRLSYADLEDVRRSSRRLEDLGGYAARAFTLAAHDEAERIRGGSVTPNLFPMLGAQPALGRHFLPEEAQAPGFEQVVILSHRLWQRRLGGAPGIVGAQVRVNQRPLTVVGVMPEGFQFPERDELWVPYRQDDAPRDRRFVAGVGTLREDATLAQLRQELDAVADTLARRHPETNRGWGLHALAYRDLAFDRPGRVAVLSLMAAVLFVLLIGCANLANLLLARGVARQREIAVRAAVGASRGRIVRQMLVESLLLALAGAALGALLGRAGLEAVVASWPEELPYWVRLDLDLRILGFLAATAVLTTLAFGLFPALRASRPNVVEELKDGARSAGSARDRRVQAGLVVGQVALCLALLVGANLMIRSFLEMQSADVGFDESGLVSFRVYLPGDAYDPLPAKAAFIRRAVERLRAVPGVSAAAATSAIPADDGGTPVRLVADGRPALPGEETGAQRIAIGPSLFETLGISLDEGRTFTEGEAEDAEATVALVNRTLARRFWPQGDVLGRRIGLVEAGGTVWLSVIGVVPDVQYEEFGEETDQSRLHVYLPYGRAGARSTAFLVRGAGPADALLSPVRRALAEAEAEAPVFDLMAMTERRRLTTWHQRFFGQAMGVFASVAVLLACLGVYGVLTYMVRRRRREIGVRMALGASPADVLRLVVGRAAGLALLGVALGLVLAAALAHLLQGILYGVGAGDPWALAGMAALLLAVVLAASALPARRAARTQPTEALRCD